MLIDWFTVIAQIVNFLILIFLLKRFLYQPILRAIDKREKRIANELAQAAKTKQDAETLGEEYRQKNEDFDREKVERTLKMKDEIEQERQRLLEKAKEQAEALQARQEALMQREAREFEQSFRQKMAETVVSASGKALKDLSGEDLEERMIDVFLDRLSALDEKELDTIQSAGPDEPIVVSSSSLLAQARREQIREVLSKTFSGDAPIHFETDHNLVCGIAVTWGSYRIAWNLSDYLSSLEKSLEPLVSLPDSSGNAR